VPSGVRGRLLVLVVTLLVAASACRVATDVEVVMQRDGSGVVSVTVVLDRQAAAHVPNLATQLRTEDLRRTGWRIVGPARTADGGFRVAARKRFDRAEQAGAVLQELTGPNGPFRSFVLQRTHSFASTRYAARGTVDLSRGLASFSDPQVAALLDGQPFGRPEAELRLLAGGSLADAAPIRVRIELPSGGERSYDVRLGGPPVRIDTRGVETSTRAYVLLGSAAVAAVLAAVAAVSSIRRRRRPPRREQGLGTYLRQPYETIPDSGRGTPPGVGRTPRPAPPAPRPPKAVRPPR